MSLLGFAIVVFVCDPNMECELSAVRAARFADLNQCEEVKAKISPLLLSGPEAIASRPKYLACRSLDELCSANLVDLRPRGTTIWLAGERLRPLDRDVPSSVAGPLEILCRPVPAGDCSG